MDVDNHQESTTKDPKRHEILWFEEGNVVLATDKYLFKVHKSLLSLHSSVFKDMFSLPSIGGHVDLDEESEGNQSAGMYEGVPLVKLAGDIGDDVAHLLRAIFEPNYYHRDSDETPLEVVTSLLRLSTKYDFAYLRKDVIRQISKHYPMDFEKNNATNGGDEHIPLFGLERWQCHYPLLSALFTGEVTTLLPILYASCSSFGIDQVFGFGRELPTECLHTLISGREKFDIEINRMLAGLPIILTHLPELRNPSCGKEGRCIKNTFFVDIPAILHTEFGDSNGLTVSNLLQLGCSSCSAIVAKAIDEKREGIWAEVPGYFGFSDWDTLQSELEDLLS